MSTIPVLENVRHWRREGRNIRSGQTLIAHFTYETDACLFEKVLERYVERQTKAQEATEKEGEG